MTLLIVGALLAALAWRLLTDDDSPEENEL